MFFVKQIQKRIKNEKGLTLVELLAVIVILAIIAAIAIPSIGNIIANSRTKAVIADAQNIMSSAQLYFMDNSTETEFNQSDSYFNEFVESPGKIKDAVVTKTPGQPNTITFTAPVNGGTQVITATSTGLSKLKVNKGVFSVGDGDTTTTVGALTP